ncbi:MAG: hypothetical protein K0R69_2587 [Clostridia bacterium]|nr:hypothetical protein [Clostridia bacterium]
MQVIVECNQKNNGYLTQYTSQAEALDLKCSLLEIEEKYLQWLSGIVDYIEPNFTMELCEEEWIDEQLLQDCEVIFGFIGAKGERRPADAYYNISTHTFKMAGLKGRGAEMRYISCYSESNTITAGDYIKCVHYLSTLASEHQKPIIIYGSLHVPNETYRYRALAYKIANAYLEKMDGVLIVRANKRSICKYYTPLKRPFECYANHVIYLEDSPKEALKRALPFLHVSRETSRFKKIYKHIRKNGMLYEDVFYGTIPENEKIYVFLNSGNYRKPAYYEELGIQAIRLIDDYSMLYAEKRLFNQYEEVLKMQITPQYHMPILSYQLCNEKFIQRTGPVSLTQPDLSHKGRGIYIGIVGVDGVDYTNNVLRSEDGGSRIACIWEQKEGDEGTYYLKEQINAALATDNPTEQIPISDFQGLTTPLLGIAGGLSIEEAYRGVATEAEFLVAKINRAPESLQKIYGGMPSENAVLMADALIGMIKLISFANQNQKPLVLCMPFNGNIDAHDGSFTLSQVMLGMAEWPYLTLVLPVGDEADKEHHYSITGRPEGVQVVNIVVEAPNQNVVGVIYQNFSTIRRATLYPPQATSAEAIHLKSPGITNIAGGTTIYSNGERINFSNGTREMLFRINNPREGGWRLEIELEPGVDNNIKMWISQQEINNHVKLNPSEAFTTVGSTASINHMMTVGGYDRDNMIVLRSSGRGYSWDGEVQPLFLVHSAGIIAPCKQGQWISLTNTLAAAGMMTGAIAVLYQKFIEEEVFPFPNTLVMNRIILDEIKQFSGVEYPNPSQGYGIFEISALQRLLAKSSLV